MPESGTPEASAIDAAYEEQVQNLFRILVTNLGDEPVSHQSDQQCLAKFTAGLAIARRARKLALSVLTAQPAEVA